MASTEQSLDELKQSILKSRMRRRMARQEQNEPLAIPRADRNGPQPLSWSQQRLWFLDQLDHAAGAAYHIPAALRLSGALNRSALQRSLDRIVERHEVLRTTFANVGGTPLQQIETKNCRFALIDHDLRSLSEHEQEASVDKHSSDEASASFDLSRGPLIRARLLRLSEREHVLLVTQHHIIADGWSIAVLVKEVSALYTAFSQGHADPLSPLAIQYSDYAIWQQQRLQGESLQSQLDYWREHLEGAPALLELPLDHPRPAKQSYAGDSIELRLTAALSAALRSLSKRHGVTLFMTLLAGWSALLSRLSGQDSVVIGTPTANRQRAEVERLIGFFVNTLALRADLTANPSVAELLAQVKATTLGAFAHQDLPFEQVVETLRPERDLSYSPVFQVLLSVSRVSAGENLALPDLELKQMTSPYNSVHFDLDMSFVDGGAQISGKFSFSSALFARATIRRFSQQLVAVLEGMVADQNRTVSSLPLLPNAEREQVLTAFNATQAAYPHEQQIHQLFEAQAALQPDAEALFDGEQSLSYAELNRQANRVAHRLIALGVGADDRVAICAERSVSMVVGLLGILKAGGAYVPLDPVYPSDRLAYMLADSEPRAVLTQSALRDALPLLAGAGRPLLIIDDDQPDDAKDHSNPRRTDLCSSNLAYMIYTSGSTGQPKGVLVEHRSAVNFWQVMGQTTHRECPPNARVGLNAAFSFDMSLKGILQLLSGHCLVLIPQAIRASGPDLLLFIERHRIDAMDSTPSQIEGLLAAGLLDPTGHRPSSVLLGGEAIGPELWKRLKSSPAVCFHNMYGPTECTVDATIERIADSLGGPVIGRPVANVRIYILDVQQQPVPIGVSGEIYIAGEGVARGYHNRPDLTAERFFADPFHGHGRMYKTGDLGRWQADGNIQYLGRNDFQVKVRGFRIELGEIEAQLLRCPDIDEAVVIAREDSPGDQRLVAYVVWAAGTELPASELRDQLLADLPEHMIPSAFVSLESLPLTTNGKLDRKALPAPDQDAVASRVYEAPVGEVEQHIAEIWQDLLGLEKVGRHDHFFELGGHSLLLIKLIEQLRQRDLNADVRTVFTTPVLSELANKLQTVNEQTAIAEVPANLLSAHTPQITPDLIPLVRLTQTQIDAIVAQVPGGVSNVQDIYPLAALQQGILFHHLLDEDAGGDAYLLSTAMAFDSRERLDNFLAVLQQVIDRHDILRSAVLWKDLDDPIQVVYRRAPIPVREPELSADKPVLEQLMALSDPRTTRLDLRRAPVLAANLAHDDERGEWLLVLLNHHIVCDHIAQELILSEIQMILRGDVDRLAPSIPYRNFIAATNSTSESEHEAYFRQQLGDINEPTALFGALNVQTDGSDNNEARVRFSAAFSQGIRERARQSGVSPAVLFHVGWAQVLAQCTGLEDVVFGSVLSGRLQATEHTESVVGMFINTLPIRIPVGQLSVADSVRDTHGRLSELLTHEQAPLALAQRCSGVAPTLPLFTSLLNFRHSLESTEADELAINLATWEGVRVLSGYASNNYPVTMSVDDFGEAFGLSVSCAPTIDARRLAGYMHAAVGSLIDALATDQSLQLRQLSILSKAERQDLLELSNGRLDKQPQNGLVHESFEAHALATPEASALFVSGRQYSYSELNLRANTLARRLIDLGVVPDDCVALCAERDVEMVIGLLAVLKAGGAYVPLDPHYPEERVAFVLGDCAAKVILTTTQLEQRLPALRTHGRLLKLDEQDRTSDAEQVANPHVRDLDGRSLAYVIYTSGSTGQPKGVMVPHQGVLNYVQHVTESYISANICGSVVATPLSFDATVTTLLGPWMAGKPVVLLAEDNDRCLQQLLDYCARPEPWLFKLTPAHLSVLAGLSEAPVGPTAHRLVVGGEQLTSHTLQRFRERVLPQATVINEYGPTEAVVGCTVYSSTSGENPLSRAVVPIGRPIANARIYILGQHGEPSPMEVVGEIYIGGAGVTRGYLNQPELTAERFVSDPFCAASDARMYRTGDLARWLPDGNIEYLGRNDFQVKIRGFRIELGEIESKLVAQTSVAEAIVTADRDVSDDARLVAYVVAVDGSDIRVDSLRNRMARELPEYMIPSAFVILDEVPLTANGKVNRKALPAPDQESVAKREYESPKGKVEEAIAAIWQDLLGLQQVGRQDHFFELGGHSLTALRLVSRLKSAFGSAVLLRDVFAKPTLWALAQAVAAADIAVDCVIPLAARTRALPLSWSQQRLWFLNQLDTAAGASYHLPVALRMRGELNKHALQASLNRIVARHESLRTVFVADADTPRQAIAPADTGFQLSFQDLTCLEANQRDAVVNELSVSEARAPFDLSVGPLIRGQLLQVADQEHVLLVTQHHIVSDAWSIGVLVKEVSALYGAMSRGEPDPLPPLAIQYADYAVWQQQWLTGGLLSAQLDYWRDQLVGAPPLLTLPSDRPRPNAQSYRGSRAPIRLSKELSASLRSLSKQHSTTLFMTLLAAWSTLLGRLSGQDEIVIGSPIANRQRVETEPLIGFFVNTLALRVNLQRDLSVAGLLEQIKTTTLGAYAHQDVPFEQVVEAVQPARSLSHSPIFQVWLTLDNTPSGGDLDLKGIELSSIDTLKETARFDLSLSLTDTPEGLVGSMVYAADLFDLASVEGMLSQWIRLLSEMVADDRQLVGLLPLLSDADREQVLTTFNATQADYPREALIHELFEAQVQLQPNAEALFDGEQTLSYAELNRRANGVAQRLMELGVGADDRVAICAERSASMVVGVLGVLKAGGAYVPLDPLYPADRLAYMLADSEPRAVLTQSGLRDVLPLLAEAGQPLLIIDEEGVDGLQTLVNPVRSDVCSSNLAYVIYTSGSTGQPKGVMVEHRSAVNFWQVMAQTTHRACGPNSRIALNAAFSFDMSLKGILQLLSGHCLVLIPQSIRASGPELLAFIEDQRIDAMDSTPSQIEGLLSAGLMDPTCHRPRSVMLGGEAISASLWVRLKSSPVVQFHNMYGPTECTIDATIENITCSVAGPVIGRPVANVQIYILDVQKQPVPVGVAGEIYIAGEGVARGYHNRPELTGERFFADPFRGEGRMYKTGDLGRWQTDGNIQYLGRNDFQVKVRGFRIELGEIEAQLLRCAEVDEAVLLAREDSPGDQRLVAYIVSAAGAELSVSGLRDRLLDELPEHMIPSAFVNLESLPLTTNGKLDRQALPAPDQDAVASRTYAAPIGEVEQQIAEIWQDLLGLERVGRHDHFFELGGHSLLVMQLVIRIREKVHVDLPLRTFFEQPILYILAKTATDERLRHYSTDDVAAVEDELGDLSEEELLAMLSTNGTDYER